jgi:hypothetical protein
MSAMIFKKTVTNKTKIKKMLSPSQSIRGTATKSEQVIIELGSGFTKKLLFI